nr:hypothetical protein [Tanacetum cinerariifolium]
MFLCSENVRMWSGNDALLLKNMIKEWWLKEEKARKRRKVFNWETAKYDKIWYDEDIHDLRSIETKFPAISFNDGVSSKKHFLVNPHMHAMVSWHGILTWSEAAADTNVASSFYVHKHETLEDMWYGCRSYIVYFVKFGTELQFQKTLDTFIT